MAINQHDDREGSLPSYGTEFFSDSESWRGLYRANGSVCVIFPPTATGTGTMDDYMFNEQVAACKYLHEDTRYLEILNYSVRTSSPFLGR